MGSLALKMGFSIWVYFCFLSFNGVYTEATSLSTNGFQSIEGNVVIDGGHAIGITDSDFICATMDWWPPEKCDYGTCAWDHSSMLNLDLNNIIFLNAIKAFSPLKIRLGGSLQDKVIYQTEDNLQPCTPFTRNNSEMFGFTSGCLPLSRWDELNYFFNKSGAQIVFGLNALQGRVIRPDKSATGAWDSKNAESLMRYTVKKGYNNVIGWELGNELCGTGVGLHVAADQYAYDTISLRNLVEEIYNGVEFKPKVISPGGFFEAKWFQDFVNKANNSVDAITHHIYNLGPGVDDHLVSKILDPLYLDGEASVFRQLQNIVRSSGSNASAWVGESGGAYNSGRDHVTNAFVFSFWYLDQLGMASSFDTKTYCRQSLIGGNYGLLNTTTFVPNPDYYSALLWHQLMGREVLATTFTGTKKIRAYSHCAKQSKGVTLLLINLDGNTTVEAKVSYNNTWMPSHRHGHHHRHGKTIQMPHESKTGVIYREEYHLTAKNRNLQSRIMMLNGSPLMIDSDGGIPLLSPILVDSVEPISVGPYSIVFIHMSYVHLPACK